MMRRIYRQAAVLFACAALLGGCLSSGVAPSGGTPPGAAPADGTTPTVTDTPAAEPKPLPGGVTSPGVDLNDENGQVIASYSVRGTYATVCSSPEKTRIKIDGRLVLTWKSGGESCTPLSKMLVSVVTVDGQPVWASHAMDDQCQFSTVIEAPFGPRQFYLVDCDGFLCRPKEGQEPLPSDFTTPTIAKVVGPCFNEASSTDSSQYGPAN
jgi:hypothetical protein